MKTGEVERILDSIETGFSPEYVYCCLDTYLIPGDVLEVAGFRGMRTRCAGEPGIWIRTEVGSPVYLFWNGLLVCATFQCVSDGAEAVRSVVRVIVETGFADVDFEDIELMAYRVGEGYHRPIS
jgi:hypothetical protein